MTESRILPGYGFTPDEKDIQEAIGQAMGAASTCWDPMDCTGVFMTERASRIVDELMALVMQFTSVYRITHNDETMRKVYRGLRRAGLTDEQVINATMHMQNDGILFREAT